MNSPTWIRAFRALTVCGLLSLMVTATAWSQSASTDVAAEASPLIQTDAQRKQSLESVRKLDDHPLYTMKYYGGYSIEADFDIALPPPKQPRFGCALFAALGDPERPLYGRNFDWEFNPAAIVFSDPPDGYASVCMVDVSYLGFERQDDKFDSLEGRRNLLYAALIPFDGMNEHGLVVGMAAVDGSEIPSDASKPTVDLLRIIRIVLDRCKNVDEALEVFPKYNIDFSGGPQIHYLLADASGKSALVEYSNGKMHVLRGEDPWQTATNFYIVGNEKKAEGMCWRYKHIHGQLSKHEGKLAPDDALKLLGDVAQPHTRWSVVYDLKSQAADIVMTQKFRQPAIEFSLQDEKPDSSE
jgi:hypothetical protein